jgi:hypothetical protein
MQKTACENLLNSLRYSTFYGRSCADSVFSLQYTHLFSEPEKHLQDPGMCAIDSSPRKPPYRAILVKIKKFEKIAKVPFLTPCKNWDMREFCLLKRKYVKKLNQFLATLLISALKKNHQVQPNR